MDNFSAQKQVADLKQKLAELPRYTTVWCCVGDCEFVEIGEKPNPRYEAAAAALKKQISELNAQIPFTVEHEIALLRKRIDELPCSFINWSRASPGVLTACGERPNPRYEADKAALLERIAELETKLIEV
jgi:hypothetical protein